MKHLFALTALAAVLAFGGFVDAAGYGGAGGKVKPSAEGTITDVGSRGFKISVAAPAAKNKSDNAPAAAEKILTILCDRSTKYKNGEEAADGTIIKTGAHVAITGSTYGVDTLMATVVSVVSEHKKK